MSIAALNITPTIDQAYLPVRHHGLDLDAELVLQPEVVIIQECDEVSFRQSNPMIPRGRQPMVGLTDTVNPPISFSICL